MPEGLVVDQVRPGSIAAQMGVEPGDRVVAVNGHPIADLIDYRFYSTDERLTVALVKENGEEWRLEVEKHYDEDLGVHFARSFPRIRRCRNRCVFCFVDQMPPGMRRSLYVKDDDFRLSFLEGNFITLTNVDAGDLERIATQRLTPLYVSVHTTNPALRRRMLGHPRAGEIMEQLTFLKSAGIEIHAQVVLCPGLNDGDELRRTVRDLAALRPAVQSLAVVPVGRTRFRDGLFPLRPVTADQARTLIAEARWWQERYRKESGVSFVYLADEFYLLAGEPLPAAEMYDDFPQLENGVGLARLFADEWAEAEEEIPAAVYGRRVTLVTGRSAAPLLAPVVARLNAVSGLHADLAVLENRFFGPTVTVSGLLTGTDIRTQLQGKLLGDLVIVPGAAVRDDGVFLDDTTLADLRSDLGVPVVAADDPRELLAHVFGDAA